MPYICQREHAAFHMGKLVGDGQCVALVQHCAGAPHTSTWRKGESVRGNLSIQPGTAIATFDENGKYPNKAHGNHASIYISQDAKGIQVYDQFEKKGVHIRPLRWGGNPLDPDDVSNDGNYFSVIE